jgi:hypothetical protein
MTHKQTTRFFELRKKSKTSEGLTGPEDVEFGDLCEKRREEIMLMIPLPQCCEGAKKYPAVHFEVGGGDEDSHKVDGRWWVGLFKELEHVLARKDRDYYANADAFPEPKFCPYCGTPLPRMVRKKPMPPNICRVQDGGYYCSTCRENLNGCLCDPPASAFEPKPTTT